MKTSPVIIVSFSKMYLLIFGFFGIIILNSCRSSETPSQTNEGPSKIVGTYFESPLEYSAGENPVDLSLGDFNSDNQTDILVTSPKKQDGLSNIDDGTMILFQRDSSSSSIKFPYISSIIEPGVAEWRQDLVVFDFSGDNVSDIIFTHTNEASIKFFKNNGSFNFSENGSVTVGEVPINIETGDWNGDNQTDIAVVNRDNNSVSVINNSSGLFSISQNLSVNEKPVKITSGDWNNDTYMDLAVLSRNSNLVQILINNGSGFFNISDTTISVGSLPVDMIAGDWNCDSKIDLAVTNSGEDTLSLIFGKGTGSFDSPIKILTGRGPRSIVSADFNGDSKLDFVIGHQFFVMTPGLPLLTGDFSLTLSDENHSNGYSNPISFAISLSDRGNAPEELVITYVDNDSKLDILATVPSSKQLVLISGKQYTGSLSCP